MTPTPEDLLRDAGAFASRGQFSQARDQLATLLKTKPDHIDAIGMLGNIERAENKLDGALKCFDQIVDLRPEDPWPRYDSAQVLEQMGKHEPAAQHYLKAWELERKNARFALYAGYAFWQAGEHETAVHIWSVASDQDPIVRTAHRIEQADEATKVRAELADLELRRFFTQLSDSGMEKHANPERLKTAVWPQTHFGRVQYTSDNQKPFMFYAPDLPQTPVFESSKIDWSQSLQGQTSAIVSELRAYLQSSHDQGQPYVDHNDSLSDAWRKLNDKDGWNAIHLYKDAKAQDCLEHFEKTLNALKDVPLVEMFGTPMEVFFSILKPGSHIPPHFGLSNSRCTAHLPLIVPDDCDIRVADHVHKWRVGELFLFDDSFDHEAINRSDDIRIVLIFETWRPDLSSNEIAALQQTMEDRHTWLSSRRIPKSQMK